MTLFYDYGNIPLMTETPQTGLIPYADSAADEGNLSAATKRFLGRRGVQDQMIQIAGTSSSEIPGEDVVLFTMLADDSGSLNRKKLGSSERMIDTTRDDKASNAQAVRDAHNTILQGLKTSDRPATILVSTQALNTPVIYPYTKLDKAPLLDTHNFSPFGHTPLYRRSLETLIGVLLKSQQTTDEWKNPRTITVILSDGGNAEDGINQNGLDQNGEPAVKAEDVARVAADLLKTGRHILAAVGLEDGITDFRRVFISMGIPEENILTAKDTKALLEKIRSFTKATVKATNVKTDEEFLLLTDGKGFGRELTQQS